MDTTDRTERAIEEVQAAGEALAVAIEREELAMIEASELGDELTAILLRQDNPTTGKPHSATSAEKAAKELPEYRDAQRRIVQAKRAHQTAWTRYEVAKLNAWRWVRAEAAV